MKGDSGKTESVWRQAKFPGLTSPLREDTAAEVCIVGAGVAGITSAYLLSRAGKKVVLIDDGPILGGETCRTTAHLSNALDDRYYELERLHGSHGARMAAESHSAAIRKIEELAAEEGIDCEFASVNGYLFVPQGHSTKVLEMELEAARRAGVPEITLLPRAPLEFFNTGPALRFGKQGQIHPIKYLEGLVAAILKNGGQFFTRTHVNGVEDGNTVEVKTAEGHCVRAKSCIVAANTPFNDWVVMHTKQAAYRTYVIGARIPRGSVPKMLLWDEPRPYHYVRGLPQSYHYVRVHSPEEEGNHAGHDLLIVGGEDHKTGQAKDPEARYRRLETWARERFPMMERIEYRWSGQVVEPVDGMAFIGRNPKNRNVFIATGDSGMGMTHGTIAGMLLTDMICGRPNEWEKLYDPSRITLKAAWSYVRENANVARQYLDWLTPGEVHSAEDIRPGSGAVVRQGTQKIAVYRDEGGLQYACSAVCPHLGGILAWNSLEKTWDCPCHGSRFDPFGKVINGPAMANLPLAAVPQIAFHPHHNHKKPTTS